MCKKPQPNGVNASARCKCETIDVSDDPWVYGYAKSHLTELSVDLSEWHAYYKCPITGICFVMDWPHSHLHGGGWPRISRDSPTVVNEQHPP